MMMEKVFPRRHVVRLGLTLGVLMVAGCSGGVAKAERLQMTVYRDPNCGCCEKWAAQAQQAGFDAKLMNDSDMLAVKRRFGVPDDLASCHTAVVSGYAIEGHVPLADVKRLLRDRPAGVKGLVVPGMPAGSPGMEMPDDTKEPFEVISFGSGRTGVFSKSA